MSSTIKGVYPGNPDSPYDFALTDGKQAIGLICVNGAESIGRNPVQQSSLKTTSGNQKYSDLKPPYMTLAQEDWTGGRAAEEFEDDVTRYADGLRMNTERSTGVMLAGRERYATGLRADMRSLPGAMKLVPLIESNRFLAVRKQAGESFSAGEIWFWVRKRGTPKGSLTVRLRNDSVGLPGTVLGSTTLDAADIESLVSYLEIFSLTSAISVTSGSYYWVEIYGADGDNSENHWEVGMKEEAGATKSSSDGTTYSSSTLDLYYRVTIVDSGDDGYQFKYKKALYRISKPSDGSAATLEMNGVRGVAISNSGSLNKLKCAAVHGLADDAAIGGVVVVIEGTGSTESQNWRTITDNDSDTFTVDRDFEIVHDTTTVWVVLGLDYWQEIGSTGLTKPVTDVLESSANYVYFCQGEETVMVRMKEEQSGGAWVRTFDAETTNAVYLAEYNNSGTMTLVRTNGDGTASEIATPTTWIDIAAWGTATKVGNPWDRITGVVQYKDYNLEDIVMIFKEEGPWSWKAGVVDKMRTSEMAAIASYKNGRASSVQGSYLYFSVQNTIYRFYNPNFDDVGPTNDAGLPSGRQGPIVSFVAYPGRVIIAVDGGDDGYSAVFSGSGGSSWHEAYRAPYGQRIRGIEYQVIPGGVPDRLWIWQGQDMVWIPFPSETYDPYQDAAYPFVHEGVLEFASMTAGLYDAWKYWKALKLRTQNLSSNATWIEADYRLSEADDWVEFPDVFATSPVQSQEFDNDFGVAGQVLYLRFRVYSTALYSTPKLTAAAISGVTVAEPKFSYEVLARAAYRDMKGIVDAYKPVDKVRLLDIWSGTAQPLKMACTNPLYHDIKVFLQPLPVRPVHTSDAMEEYEYEFKVVLQEA